MPVTSTQSMPQNIGPGMIGARQIQLKVILPQHISRRFYRYIFDPFDARSTAIPSIGYGASPGGAVNNLNICDTNYGSYEYHLKSAQVIVAPAYDAVNGLGLDFSLDQTAGRGVEVGFATVITGATSPISKTQFLAGTATAGKSPFGDVQSFARIKINLPNGAAAGAPLAFGLRKVAAYQSTSLGTYTDYAAFDVTAGAIRVNTNLAGAGSVVTALTGPSTSWGNTSTHEMLVMIDQGGNVRFFFDNFFVVPNVAFQFAAGTLVMPFLWYVQGATTSNVFFQQFEAGLGKPNAV
jgi:hypothetical protein